MTVGTKTLASMEAAILNGIPKGQSHLVTDAESSQAWDRLAAEIARIKREQPGVGFDIPNDPEL